MTGDSPNQEDLDRLRTDQSGKCWWCGGAADSREHKHKASLLRQMWGEEGLYLGRDGQELWSVPSVKSSAVKFGKTLCRECNNARSQPFDEAYDKYAKYVWEHARSLSRAKQIDWADVYGPDWQESVRDLGKYFIKATGCWMADGGFSPPAVFVQFLEGGPLVDAAVMPMRQQSATLAYRAMRLGGELDFDRGIGFLDGKAWLNSERTDLAGFDQISYISDICVRVAWHDQGGPGPVFWDTRVPPLTVMPAMFSQRVLAMRIGIRSLRERMVGILRRRDTAGAERGQSDRE